MSDALSPAPDVPRPLPRPEPVVVPDGDVLLVRARDAAEADAMADAVAELAKARNTLVLLLVGEVRLEALDEAAMRQAGWVRVDASAPSAERLARVVLPE